MKEQNKKEKSPIANIRLTQKELRVVRKLVRAKLTNLVWVDWPVDDTWIDDVKTIKGIYNQIDSKLVDELPF